MGYDLGFSAMYPFGGKRRKVFRGKAPGRAATGGNQLFLAVCKCGLSQNRHRKPGGDHVYPLSETGSDYSAVAVWAWGNKENLSMVERLAPAGTHGNCQRERTKGVADATRPR